MNKKQLQARVEELARDIQGCGDIAFKVDQKRGFSYPAMCGATRSALLHFVRDVAGAAAEQLVKGAFDEVCARADAHDELMLALEKLAEAVETRRPDHEGYLALCAQEARAAVAKVRNTEQAQAERDWLRKWPRHCKACGGWGGSTFYQSHGPGLSEQMFDVCEALPEATRCHRCGEHGLSEDGEGPCKHCGWNYDDGVPRDGEA